MIVAVVAVGAVLLLGGGSSSDDGQQRHRSVARDVANTNLTLAAGDVTAESAGPPVTVCAASRPSGVIDIHRATTSRPRSSSRCAPGSLPATSSACSTLRRSPARTGVDRAALVDEGHPEGDRRPHGDRQAGRDHRASATRTAHLVAITATVDLDISAAPVGKAHAAAHRAHRARSCCRPTRAAPGRCRRTTCRDPRRRRHRRPDHDGRTAVTRPMTALAVAAAGALAHCSSTAPVVCGLLVAGSSPPAWLALGRADTRRRRGVVPGRRSSRAREYTGAPDQPFFVLVAGTGARSDDPNEQHDDPGLADAIHVDRHQPCAARRRRSSTSRATPRARPARSSTRTSSTATSELRAARRGRRGLVGDRAPDHLRGARELPELRADDRRDRRDRRRRSPTTWPTRTRARSSPPVPQHLTGDQALALLPQPLHAAARRPRPHREPGAGAARRRCRRCRRATRASATPSGSSPPPAAT